MKKKLLLIGIILCIFVVFIVVSTGNVIAKINPVGYKDENEIYFNLPHQGLMKYNINTGNTAVINTLKLEDEVTTRGVTVVSRRGDWLYGEWDQTTGTAFKEMSYIVKINLKTHIIIKLAEGTQPVVKGKNIYFSGLEKEEVAYDTYNYLKSNQNYVCDLYGKHLKKTNKKIIIKTTKNLGNRYKLYTEYDENGINYNMNVILKLPNGNKEIIGKYFEA